MPARSRSRDGIDAGDQTLAQRPDGRIHMADYTWHEIDEDDLAVGDVKAVVVGRRAVCLARTADGLDALDNRCPWT